MTGVVLQGIRKDKSEIVDHFMELLIESLPQIPLYMFPIHWFCNKRSVISRVIWLDEKRHVLQVALEAKSFEELLAFSFLPSETVAFQTSFDRFIHNNSLHFFPSLIMVPHRQLP